MSFTNGKKPNSRHHLIRQRQDNKNRSASVIRRFRLLFDYGFEEDDSEGETNCETESTATASSWTTPLHVEPKNFEALQNEGMLNGVMGAFPHLQFASLRIQIEAEEAPSPAGFWHMLMENFESAVDMGLEYVRLLPGIGLINPNDRRRIFSECLLPMAAVQQILMSKETSSVPGEFFFLNMTPQARALFVSYFPAYQLLVKETYEIGIAIGNWAPSKVEVAFLEALLFYHCDAPGLQNAAAVGRLRAQLMRTIEDHLKSTCSEEKAASVMNQLLSVYNLLMKLPEVHSAVLAQMHSQHSHIIESSLLLREVYSDNDESSANKRKAARSTSDKANSSICS